VLFGRPKEGDFYPTQLRDDYALVDDDGTIIQPSLSELRGRVLRRHAEIHDKTVPYR